MANFRVHFRNGRIDYYYWPTRDFMDRYTGRELDELGISSIAMYSPETGCWIRHRLITPTAPTLTKKHRSPRHPTPLTRTFLRTLITRFTRRTPAHLAAT